MTTKTRKPYDRCALFDGIDMSAVYMDWSPGSPLTFYIKMPGGVPGLEKKISGDNGSWEYSATIGDYSTDKCSYQGYQERLYCSVSLPSGYSNAVRPMSLRVNGCASPIYSTPSAYLPGIESGGGSGNSGEGDSCPAGQTYHTPNSNWPGGCCSDGHWYIWDGHSEPGCWD